MERKMVFKIYYSSEAKIERSIYLGIQFAKQSDAFKYLDSIESFRENYFIIPGEVEKIYNSFEEYKKDAEMEDRKMNAFERKVKLPFTLKRFDLETNKRSDTDELALCDVSTIARNLEYKKDGKAMSCFVGKRYYVEATAKERDALLYIYSARYAELKEMQAKANNIEDEIEAE